MFCFVFFLLINMYWLIRLLGLGICFPAWRHLFCGRKVLYNYQLRCVCFHCLTVMATLGSLICICVQWWQNSNGKIFHHQPVPMSGQSGCPLIPRPHICILIIIIIIIIVVSIITSDRICRFWNDTKTWLHWDFRKPKIMRAVKFVKWLRRLVS